MPSYVSASKNSLCLFSCSLAFLLSPMSRVGRACVVAPELLCLGKKEKDYVMEHYLSNWVLELTDQYLICISGIYLEVMRKQWPSCVTQVSQFIREGVYSSQQWCSDQPRGKTYWKRALFPIIAAMLDAKHSSYLKESKSLFWSQVWVTMVPKHRLGYSKYCALKPWPFGEVSIVTEPWIEVLFKCIGRNIRWVC